ncbi:MAG: 50S ribosomal protein L9 [Candidatus Omnitrophica bacterium]|nr:50S ribosomal protein L9 [Candidatus Omnitrophota bacterium]
MKDIEVILTDNDPKLGSRGGLVKVTSGYAYNYLIPSGKAKLATPSNLKSFELEKLKRSQKESDLRAKADALAAKIKETGLTVQASAGESDKLFGSVTSQDIQEALLKQGIALDKKDIHLQEPVRRLGDYEIPVKLHPEVQVKLKLAVVKKA